MTNAYSVSHGEMGRKGSSVSFVVYGQCYSMKNSKILGRFKHPKAQRFAHDFALQVVPSYRKKLGSFQRPLRAIVTVYYPSRRQDLDCALVYDCLQANEIITNDRWIVEKREQLYIDPKNPRVEITVEEI